MTRFLATGLMLIACGLLLAINALRLTPDAGWFAIVLMVSSGATILYGLTKIFSISARALPMRGREVLGIALGLVVTQIWATDVAGPNNLIAATHLVVIAGLAYAVRRDLQPYGGWRL